MTKKLTREKFLKLYDELDERDELSRYNLAQQLEKLGYIEPEKEPLTFSQIRKECVSGESVLVDEYGEELVYVGFCERGYLVAESNDRGFLTRLKEEVVSWTIKPKEEKKAIEIDKEIWVNVYEDGSVGSCWDSKKEADSSFANNRIACRIACEKFHLKRLVEVWETIY